MGWGQSTGCTVILCFLKQTKCSFIWFLQPVPTNNSVRVARIFYAISSWSSSVRIETFGPACESQTGSFGSGSASLAWLALGSADCEARDCDRLAPPRFSTVLKCGCLGPFNPTCLRPRRKENHFATSSRLSTLQDQDIVALGVVDYSPFRSARTVRLGVNNSVFANCIHHG